MTKHNSTLLKRLSSYSAAAGSLVAVAGSANAQVIYTDINPDVVLANPHDSLQLDLNNDGIADFVFKEISYGSNWQRAGIAPYPYSTGNTNGMQGTFNQVGAIVIGYPYALSFGQSINSSQQFFKLSDLLFTSNGNNYFVFAALASVYSGLSYGHFPGVTDHYVGLRFSDGTNTYYGWARCDVSADATSMTIKDYAYNSTPNTEILAGYGNPLGVSQVNSNSSFGIFGYEGVANVIVKDGKLDDATVTVTNMMGQQVVNQPLVDKITRIDLNNFGKGLYVVTIHRAGEQFSKKVSFR